VRKTPSWPRGWANCSLSQLYSHRNARANLNLLGQHNTFYLLGQPNTFLAEGALPRRELRRLDHGRRPSHGRQGQVYLRPVLRGPGPLPAGLRTRLTCPHLVRKSTCRGVASMQRCPRDCSREPLSGGEDLTRTAPARRTGSGSARSRPRGSGAAVSHPPAPAPWAWCWGCCCWEAAARAAAAAAAAASPACLRRYFLTLLVHVSGYMLMCDTL
jgi:hypothetical protein